MRCHDVEYNDWRTWAAWRGQDALELFRKMKADGLVPDAYSFVALLSACSHAGLIDEGRQIFCAMKDYGVEPVGPCKKIS